MMTTDNFKSLFKETSQMAFYYAYRMVQDSDIAEDIVSDCYADLYNHSRKNHAFNAKNLLFTLIRHRSLSTIKRQKMERINNEIFLANSHQDQDTSIEIELVRSELLSQISDNVEKLPSQSKKVFKLHYFEQLSMEEISKKLNLNKSTVYNHIARARHILRASLKGELPKTEIHDQPGENVRTSIKIKTDEINAELIKHLAKHPQSLYDLTPRRYEELIAELLKDMGYEVYLTPQTRDGGRDVIAVITIPPNEKIVTLVECKKWHPSRKIQPDQVKSFLYTLNEQDKANFGMMATTSFFSSGAQELQKIHKWKLSLYDFDKMNEWLINYGQWHKSSGLWLPKNPLIDSNN